jgi:ABC-type nickel/cobalt efflux system permease component RcnA
LTTSQTGAGTAPALAQADLWRQQASGKGEATLTVEQDDAPETVVVATASGKPAELAELTVEWQRPAWSLEALAVLVVGLLAAAAGALGLWRLRPTALEAGLPSQAQDRDHGQAQDRDHGQDHGQAQDHGQDQDQGQDHGHAPRPVATASQTTVPEEDRS